MRFYGIYGRLVADLLRVKDSDHAGPRWCIRLTHQPHRSTYL